MHPNRCIFYSKYNEEDYEDSVNLCKKIKARNITNKHL